MSIERLMERLSVKKELEEKNCTITEDDKIICWSFECICTHNMNCKECPTMQGYLESCKPTNKGEMKMKTNKTNAQRNYEMEQLLIDLYEKLTLDYYYDEMCNNEVTTAEWELLHNIEKLIKKYEHATRKAEYWSEKNDMNYDEYNVPTYTAITYVCPTCGHSDTHAIDMAMHGECYVCWQSRLGELTPEEEKEMRDWR